MKWPAAVAWKLLTDANGTEEQTDAVALYALSLQTRFEERPGKTTIRLPVATPTNNHRALWLGGGGVGNTRTLEIVFLVRGRDLLRSRRLVPLPHNRIVLPRI